MAVEPQALNVTADTNRLIWVINNYTRSHVENFRGKVIDIPPNGEKKRLMPYLAACRFIGQMWPCAEPLPNGTYRAGESPKMLQLIELTPKEREKFEGLTPAQAMQKAREQEESFKTLCNKCGFQAASEKGLKIHMAKNHPDLEPVGEVLETQKVQKEPDMDSAVSEAVEVIRV